MPKSPVTIRTHPDCDLVRLLIKTRTKTIMFKLISPATAPATRRLARPALVLAAVLAASAPMLPAPSLASDAKPTATITMTGEGRISVAPDMGVVSTRVVTTGKTAPDALSENTSAMTKVIEQIKAAGIEARDIQTSGFSIYPRYEERKNNSNAPLNIVGYEVANGVTVQIRDLTKLGTILDTVVRSGANQVGGISFKVSDADMKLDSARKDAVANAKAKAELYTEAAGVKLGRVLSIDENSASMPRPYAMRAEKMMMADAAPVPVEAGEETLSSRVTITWEIVN